LYSVHGGVRVARAVGEGPTTRGVRNAGGNVRSVVGGAPLYIESTPRVPPHGEPRHSELSWRGRAGPVSVFRAVVGFNGGETPEPHGSTRIWRGFL